MRLGHRMQIPCIPILKMLWVKLIVVHGNHSKTTRHLFHRFLLPFLTNIVGFPLKSKWLCLDVCSFKQNKTTGSSPFKGKQSWKCSCCVHILKVYFVCKNSQYWVRSKVHLAQCLSPAVISSGWLRQRRKAGQGHHHSFSNITATLSNLWNRDFLSQRSWLHV